MKCDTFTSIKMKISLYNPWSFPSSIHFTLHSIIFMHKNTTGSKTFMTYSSVKL